MHHLPYPLLSDWNKTVSRAYGVLHPKLGDYEGVSKRSVFVVDSEGVALPAIQGPRQLMQEKDARIVALEQRVAEVESLRGERAALRSAPAQAL